MSAEKEKMVALKKRARASFQARLFTTTLVISVVLLVSIPIGLRFSENQERTLAQGLESRVQVLLESLASGARAYLPSRNLLELGFLPAQMSALTEARYATITGNHSAGSVTGVDFVWATNDPEIAQWIDTDGLAPGVPGLLVRKMTKSRHVSPSWTLRPKKLLANCPKVSQSLPGKV